MRSLFFFFDCLCVLVRSVPSPFPCPLSFAIRSVRIMFIQQGRRTNLDLMYDEGISIPGSNSTCVVDRIDRVDNIDRDSCNVFSSIFRGQCPQRYPRISPLYVFPRILWILRIPRILQCFVLTFFRNEISL